MTPKEAFEIILGNENSSYPDYEEAKDTVKSALNRLEELEKVLSFIKEHTLLDGSILRANFQWDLDIEENGELLKEYLK